MRALLIAACTLTVGGFLAAQQPQTFGAGVSLTETTPLVQLLDRPGDFEGKTVRVEGVVTAVCMHMGCWMALTPQASTESRTMLIKVDDGVIVFPPSAKGRRAIAQGVVERIGGSREGQEAAAEHARSTGPAKSAPVTWQLKATGATLLAGN
jgi:hypothetical protein